MVVGEQAFVSDGGDFTFFDGFLDELPFFSLKTDG